MKHLYLLVCQLLAGDDAMHDQRLFNPFESVSEEDPLSQQDLKQLLSELLWLLLLPPLPSFDLLFILWTITTAAILASILTAVLLRRRTLLLSLRVRRRGIFILFTFLVPSRFLRLLAEDTTDLQDGLHEFVVLHVGSFSWILDRKGTILPCCLSADLCGDWAC